MKKLQKLLNDDSQTLEDKVADLWEVFSNHFDEDNLSKSDLKFYNQLQWLDDILVSMQKLDYELSCYEAEGYVLVSFSDVDIPLNP